MFLVQTMSTRAVKDTTGPHDPRLDSAVTCSHTLLYTKSATSHQSFFQIGALSREKTRGEQAPSSRQQIRIELRGGAIR
jgi:hypothetical protein